MGRRRHARIGSNIQCLVSLPITRDPERQRLWSWEVLAGWVRSVATLCASREEPGQQANLSKFEGNLNVSGGLLDISAKDTLVRIQSHSANDCIGRTNSILY